MHPMCDAEVTKEAVPNCQAGSESFTAGIYSAMVYLP